MYPHGKIKTTETKTVKKKKKFWYNHMMNE